MNYIYIPVAKGQGLGSDPGKFEGGGQGVFSRVHLDAGNGHGCGAIPLPAH